MTHEVFNFFYQLRYLTVITEVCRLQVFLGETRKLMEPWCSLPFFSMSFNRKKWVSAARIDFDDFKQEYLLQSVRRNKSVSCDEDVQDAWCLICQMWPVRQRLIRTSVFIIAWHLT